MTTIKPHTYVPGPLPEIHRGFDLPRGRIVRLPTPHAYKRLLSGSEPIVFFAESHHYAAPKVRVESLVPFFGAWKIGMLGLEPFMAADQDLLDRYAGGAASLVSIERYLRKNWAAGIRGISHAKRQTDGDLPLSYMGIVARAAQEKVRLLAVNYPVTRRNGRERKIKSRIWKAHQRNQRRRDGMVRTAIHIGALHTQLDPKWAAGMLAAHVPVLSIRFFARAIGEPQRLLHAIARAGMGDKEFAIPGVDVGLPMYSWMVYLPNR